MKKLTVFSNEILVYTYIALHFVVGLICVIMCFIDPICIEIMLLWIITVIITCCTTERWCLMITFDQNGILYKPLFRKGVWLKYCNFPRIQHAYYMHGNIIAAYKVNYFVFSNRRLSNEELTHINGVTPSSNLIKIRYTQKNYKKLIEALPSSVAIDVKRIHDIYMK